MSDELNQVQSSEATAAGSKKPGFLSTATGKIVAIVVGLGVLGIIAGVAVAIVLYVFGNQVVDEIQTQIEQSPVTAESATSTASVEAKTPATKVSNADVFTFRDIFSPLIEPEVVASASSTTPSTTTTTTDTVTPTNPGTLYLDGVVTEDGVLKAQLRYNGSSYSLAPGGVIPNSPWQVLRVSTSSVVMLYGDVQVTLGVGQGITK